MDRGKTGDINPDNTMNIHTIKFGIAGILAAVIGALVFSTFFYQSSPVSAAYFNGTAISAATTTASVAVTSSTRLLATTTNTVGTGYTRVYATLCNPSATLVYVNMNQDKAASLSAAQVVIAAAAGYNACYEITDRNQYSGSIQASSTNQTSVNVIVSDYVQ